MRDGKTATENNHTMTIGSIVDDPEIKVFFDGVAEGLRALAISSGIYVLALLNYLGQVIEYNKAVTGAIPPTSHAIIAFACFMLGLVSLNISKSFRLPIFLHFILPATGIFTGLIAFFRSGWILMENLQALTP